MPAGHECVPPEVCVSPCDGIGSQFGHKSVATPLGCSLSSACCTSSGLHATCPWCRFSGAVSLLPTIVADCASAALQVQGKRCCQHQKMTATRPRAVLQATALGLCHSSFSCSLHALQQWRRSGDPAGTPLLPHVAGGGLAHQCGAVHWAPWAAGAASLQPKAVASVLRTGQCPG